MSKRESDWRGAARVALGILAFLIAMPIVLGAFARYLMFLSRIFFPEAAQ